VAILSGREADWLGVAQASRLRQKLNEIADAQGLNDLLARMRDRAQVRTFDAHRAALPRLRAIAEAGGDLIYLPMTYPGAEYARDVLAEIAQSLGLVCYDPQIEQLLPSRPRPLTETASS
jgi:2-methylisocitrate lyase-like PEP mutase family enzyme